MKFLFYMFLFTIVIGCSSNYKTLNYDEHLKENDSLTIKEGIVSQTAMRINYKKNGVTGGVIKLDAPITIAQAEQEEPWGFFQFPFLGKAEDGTFIVKWQMAVDVYTSYGKKSERAMTPMMSKDGGRTWQSQDKNYNEVRRDYGFCKLEKKILHVITPSAKDINEYKSFPKQVGKIGNRTYYIMDSVPEDLQGVYISVREDNKQPQQIHSKIIDPGLLRYTINEHMPIVWWGDIKQLADKSLMAGVHPCHYLDSEGQITNSSISFYRSDDEGYTWSIVSKIPFHYDGIADLRGEKAYDEPAFEILSDSIFLCVIRTGIVSPLYKTFSYDMGKTWTTPEPFTPNGVMPRLMLLKNGVLVLISGRPGVQVRFSFDGTGREWTDPIDMIPFMNDDGTFIRDVSCGYASFIEEDDDTFLLVYSDFTTKNKNAETRKSIISRRITVKKKIVKY